MSSMSNINSSIVNTQLSAVNVRNQIDVKVAKKGLDISRQQGEAVLKLLDSAMAVSDTTKPELTLGSVASGVGQNLDVKA